MFKFDRCVWLVLWAVGCSSGKGADAPSMDTALWDDDGGGSLDTSASDGSGSSASWWRLSASLELLDGLVQEEKSSFFVEVLEEDRHVTCTFSAVPSEVVPVDEPPHETIETWWLISVESWEDSCEGEITSEAMPVEFQLGLGQMHPEIMAVLDNLVQAEDGAEDSLSAAFASFDFGESILVFGTGGTADQYSGVSAESTDPLNGSVFIYPLYPFAFSKE